MALDHAVGEIASRSDAAPIPAPANDNLWLDELPNQAAYQRLRADVTLFRHASEVQDVWIFDNTAFGRVLALDGVVQAAEADEFIYHELMAHVPMFAHGAVRDVLIVGGGDGGALREVLRHRGVRRAVVAELDRTVVEACRRYFPSLEGGAFSDPRVELIVQDGLTFLRSTTESFDLILVDAPDPIGPGETLFRAEFFAACRARLKPRGNLVAQSGVTCLQQDQIRQSAERLRRQFRYIGIYTAPVPSYYGGAMAFLCASNGHGRFSRGGSAWAGPSVAMLAKLRWYSPAAHQAAFFLPVRLRAELLGLEGCRREGHESNGRRNINRDPQRRPADVAAASEGHPRLPRTGSDHL